MNRVAANFLALWVLTGLAGCAATSALVVDGTVMVDELPPHDCVKAGDTIVCPKCHQTAITPRWSRDGQGHEFLTWTCRNCGGTWRTKVATPSLKTEP